MCNRTIYPNIDVKRSMYHHVNPGDGFKIIYVFETWLRKKGKWKQKYYLQHCRSEVVVDDDAKIVTHLNHFHAQIYRALMLSKIDTKIVFPQHMGPDKPLFEVDPDQTPEEERLMPKI